MGDGKGHEDLPLNAFLRAALVGGGDGRDAGTPIEVPFDYRCAWSERGPDPGQAGRPGGAGATSASGLGGSLAIAGHYERSDSHFLSDSYATIWVLTPDTTFPQGGERTAALTCVLTACRPTRARRHVARHIPAPVAMSEVNSRACLAVVRTTAAVGWVRQQIGRASCRERVS